MMIWLYINLYLSACDIKQQQTDRKQNTHRIHTHKKKTIEEQ